jgi:site-specific recombinase XerD
MTLPEIFKNYLKIQKVSPITVKNYLADINHFLSWLAKKTGIKHQVVGKAIFGLFTKETLEEYKTDQLSENTPLSTTNRRLSTLRKFGRFGKAQGWLIEIPKVENITSTLVLSKFQKHLEKEKVSPLTIKNYLSDLRHFLGWLEAS